MGKKAQRRRAAKLELQQERRDLARARESHLSPVVQSDRELARRLYGHATVLPEGYRS
jgi:hypothetical protein